MDLEALLRFLIDSLKEDYRVPCTALKTGLKTRTSKSVSFKELSDMSASTESSTSSKWRHTVDRTNLAEVVNTEGDVVLERNQAQRNAKRLREELISSGYSPE